MGFDELMHLVRQGGLTTAVILLASVFALGVAIERLLALWGVRTQTRALGEIIAKHLLRGDIAAARTAAERSQVVAADIFIAGFERAAKTTGPGLDAAVDRERMQTMLKLRSKLWILGTIGASTPFVGLFGTVVGILKSFRDLGLDVSGGGTGGPGAVMTGISEALVATAAGIIVAVEAVIFYNYFQSRMARLSVELKLISDEFVELLRERAVNGVVPSTGSKGETAAAAPATTPAPGGA
ncbi:MAG: MotA/TolQ/ExbB proton channel family protein [Myxococcaceae bacterium]|nr:MotA/TolQ/ExbB proton channel family protein [Myxococcaceae bacterium]